jgi:hypothetical protein
MTSHAASAHGLDVGYLTLAGFIAVKGVRREASEHEPRPAQKKARRLPAGGRFREEALVDEAQPLFRRFGGVKERSYKYCHRRRVNGAGALTVPKTGVPQ